MKQAVLVIDVQPNFNPPRWLVERCQVLASSLPSIATVVRHDEAKVPFFEQLGWKPDLDNASLVQTDRTVIKHGYGPPSEVIEQFKNWKIERVLVCGIQADACVLAAGFALFDAGLHPTIVADAVFGSSLDRSGQLGVDLWRHHFGKVIKNHLEIT